jgi:ABC-type nitrate/sulfonate/bicarbonate transport system substrate-binding protein
MRAFHSAHAVRLALAAAAVALLAAPPAVHAQQQLIPLHVGTLSSDNSAGVYYAKELGYFQKVGLDVTIDAMTSGPVTAAAVTGGAIDIGVANVATIRSRWRKTRRTRPPQI